ncbi:MAG: hypothetical protein ACK56F_03095, partial [bacterium]
MIIISLKNSVKLTTINDQIKSINKIKQRNVPSSIIIIFVSEKMFGYYIDVLLWKTLILAVK